jgi:GntR family transcriptional regulator, transcriptional repressor for pyruvate dehydrogenase complex
MSGVPGTLKRISKATMTDLVEQSLQTYFKERSLKPGDPLPKEIELVEAMGVSRNIIREALSRLKMLGMIESRKKRGMVMARPDVLGSLEKVMNPLLIDDTILKDIFELRLVIEVGLGDILFSRKTDKDLKELEAIAKKQIKDKPHTFRIKNEIDFHGKLYEMTGNDTLKRFQNMLLPIFGYVIVQEKKEHRSGSVTHIDLVNILKNGTREQFRQGMYDHLKPHFDKLNEPVVKL